MAPRTPSSMLRSPPTTDTLAMHGHDGSDDEPAYGAEERQESVEPGARRRSTRACDHCRRSKSKCERDPSVSDKLPCRACSALGLGCTYVGPSHKRGPPKGYILAIERRLHQVEALLGTIIGSDDPHARAVVRTLSQDPLAEQIIHRVDVGPFGPRGRVAHPFGSTKEDFLASLMNGVEDPFQPDARSADAATGALVSPSATWQDALLGLLRAPTSSPSTSAPGPHTPAAWSAKADPADGEEAHARLTPGDVYVGRDGQPRPLMPCSPLQTLARCYTSHADSKGKALTIFFPSPLSASTYALHVHARAPPPRQQLDLLLGYYFACAHPSFPVLHRTHFVALYHERCADSPPAGARSMNAVDGEYNTRPLTRAAFDIVLFTACSIAQRYVDPAADDGLAGEALRLLATVEGHPHPLLATAWLLLGYRSMGLGAMEDAWTFCGRGIRMAQALGAHVPASALAPLGSLSPLELEVRQQLWRGCAVADRYISVLLGRPATISAPARDVADPGDGALAPAPVSPHAGISLAAPFSNVDTVGDGVALACLAQAAALASIVGDTVAEAYRERNMHMQLEARLARWLARAAGALKFDPAASVPAGAPACVLELQMMYWWAVIVLHRPALPKPDAPLRGDLLSLAACQRAAANIAALAMALGKQAQKHVSAFVPGYIIAAGAIDILSTQVIPNDMQSAARLKQHFTVLCELEPLWPASSIFSSLLNMCLLYTSPAPPSPSPRKRSVHQAFATAPAPEPARKRASSFAGPVPAGTPVHKARPYLQGLDLGLGFITSPPYPGFADPSFGASPTSPLAAQQPMGGYGQGQW